MIEAARRRHGNLYQRRPRRSKGRKRREGPASQQHWRAFSSNKFPRPQMSNQNASKPSHMELSNYPHCSPHITYEPIRRCTSIFLQIVSCVPTTMIAHTEYENSKTAMVLLKNHRWKHGLYHEFAVHQADDVTLLGTYPKSLRVKVFPWGVASCWAPKKAKKALKSSGFLFVCIIFSETSKYGSWL